MQRLHLTGTVFDRKVAEHLPHFSFISLASAKENLDLVRILGKVEVEVQVVGVVVVVVVVVAVVDYVDRLEW